MFKNDSGMTVPCQSVLAVSNKTAASVDAILNTTNLKKIDDCKRTKMNRHVVSDP